MPGANYQFCVPISFLVFCIGKKEKSRVLHPLPDILPLSREPELVRLVLEFRGACVFIKRVEQEFFLPYVCAEQRCRDAVATIRQVGGQWDGFGRARGDRTAEEGCRNETRGNDVRPNTDHGTPSPCSGPSVAGGAQPANAPKS